MPARGVPVLAGILAGLLAASPAQAFQGDAEAVQDARPIRIYAPEEMGEAVTFPTVDLTEGGIELTSVSEDLEGAARVAEAQDTVDVVLDGNVLFGKDSAAVLPAARQRLREVIEVLQDRGPGSVHVVGHTDDLGSAAHGLDLSRRRAKAVRDLLEPALDGFDITSEGKGEAEPRVPNRDEASRALNRRVEIHFKDSGGD